ncbi:MAG: 50S ribosomal protein L25/general stress protein Ctc [Gammaproteobacteria bacterium]|jgi:large subunit ribosomal protein L25|nr:50S ribosomal protein L25/general stress protein Ctc [Gammaproteobacteria bacterium]NBR17192.1 50S ribosomal protein L25/general stress protein Ctc [Gammaproteobacteria bacterium]NCW21494.1 50S ribosomal protein L25/general stress protein Ctc [Gammaproteobacteria bacterium]NCW57665.1 50S ribosomal protein L25/general stress protein Ctc [Gammaproteobacteria bacterium]NDA43796.1 50S ribosomal protein L25/general stress protein Ctc [Gammaproteobacteria bacterium]
MKISFELAADARSDEGKGASRRLRHAGKVPAILYGGKRDPRMLSLNHEKLMTLVENEKFYSTIIGLKVGDETQPAIVKDLQMHPAKPQVLHLDLQRVLETEKIRIRLPIHFKGESISPGVKTQGGIVSHRIADIEVSCLPKDLPEEITLDLSQMKLNESKYISDVPLPAGVVATAVTQGKDQVVVSIHSPRAEEPETPVAEVAAAAAPAAGAAAPAAAGDAKKEEPKKEGAKK